MANAGMEEFRRQQLAREQRALDAMTVAQAMELLYGPVWACACVTSGPLCCVSRYRQARRIRLVLWLALEQMGIYVDGEVLKKRWEEASRR